MFLYSFLALFTCSFFSFREVRFYLEEGEENLPFSFTDGDDVVKKRKQKQIGTLGCTSPESVCSFSYDTFELNHDPLITMQYKKAYIIIW